MKKIKYLLMCLVLLITMNVSVSAAEVKESLNKIKTNKVKSSNFHADSTDTSGFAMKNIATDSLSEKNSIFYLGSKVVTSVSKTQENGMIKLSYTQGDEIFESWYKIVPGKTTYSHVKNVYIYKSSNEKVTFSFRFQSAKLINTVDLKAGNGSDNYKISSITYEELKIVNANKTIIYYSDKATDLRDTSSIYEYGKRNNKVILLNKIVYRKNSKNLGIGFYEINYSANAKISSILSVIYTNALPLNVMEYQVKYYKKTIYDSKSRIVTISIGKQGLKTSNSQYGPLIETYRETRLYYTNNKIKQKMVARNNSYKQRVALERTRYRSDGKKSSFKKRTYKNKKIVKQYTYIYNKKGSLIGNASKTTVFYNKNGKASSAYRAKYNSKGKLNKAYKIKLTKSVTSW